MLSLEAAVPFCFFAVCVFSIADFAALVKRFAGIFANQEKTPLPLWKTEKITGFSFLRRNLPESELFLSDKSHQTVPVSRYHMPQLP